MKVAVFWVIAAIAGASQAGDRVDVATAQEVCAGVGEGFVYVLAEAHGRRTCDASFFAEKQTTMEGKVSPTLLRYTIDQAKRECKVLPASWSNERAMKSVAETSLKVARRCAVDVDRLYPAVMAEKRGGG